MFYYSSTDLNEEGVTSFPPLNLMERNGQLPPLNLMEREWPASPS